MKNIFRSLVVATFALVFSGCVHYSYEGQSLPPTESAAIFENADKIPQKYEVLGKAVVYGDYQDVSREELKQKLITEAEANGADAVLITAQQVVPRGDAVTIAPALNTMEATGAENTYNLNQLQKDFDGGYGQAFDKKPVTPVIREYRRILRAEFIKYTGPKDSSDKK